MGPKTPSCPLSSRAPITLPVSPPFSGVNKSARERIGHQKLSQKVPSKKGSLGVIFSPRNYRESAHSKSANFEGRHSGGHLLGRPLLFTSDFHSGPEKGVITKGAFSLEASQKKKSLYSLEFIWENARVPLVGGYLARGNRQGPKKFPQKGYP